MSNLSQTDRIVTFLKSNQNQKFTSREIAENIISIFKEDYIDKRSNPRFSNDKEFIQQIVAEIGRMKKAIANKDNHIFWQDKPRPRKFWYDPKTINSNSNINFENIKNNAYIESDSTIISKKNISENDLYPILIDYLESEHGLLSRRIDEKRSKNTKGSGGNKWLFPDIVAIEPVFLKWHKAIQDCIIKGAAAKAKFWSFEVKKRLITSNVRESFFQAVSNSSWANYGYLVASEISNDVHSELAMLSSLHGIGVIALDIENPSESEIIFPAKLRENVDWESINRVINENNDFEDYIQQVSIYLASDKINDYYWNKI